MRAGAPDGVFEEIERMLEMPLAELVNEGEERHHARVLTEQAAACPALGRLRELVEFIGEGRRATQAGKLTPADAVALAQHLGMPEPAEQVRSMEDIPPVAHLVHWALACDLLTVRRTRIVPGFRAVDLQRDPLAAWLAAALARLGAGLLDGFRRWWRKQYVEYLDAAVPSLLAAILQAGGEVQLSGIQAGAWEQVAEAYQYDPHDERERSYTERLVEAMIAELADLGVVEREDSTVRLTEIGGLLAVAATALDEDDDTA